MTIKEALEQRGIECKECSSYEWDLTYNNNRYYLRLANSIDFMFTLRNLTTDEQICTRASFKTICRLIKLGHK